MADTLQKRTQRISLILTLAVLLFTAVDNYLYLCHGIDIAPVTTPVIIILAVSIVLCGVLQRRFARWLIKYSLFPSVNRLEPEGDEAECTRAAVTEQAENPAAAMGIEPVEEAPRVEAVGMAEPAEETKAEITAAPHRDPYMERYNRLLEEVK